MLAGEPRAAFDMALADRDSIARVLAEIAAEAGIVLDRCQREGCNSVMKPDGSPVSDADLASQTVILTRLGEAFPQWPAISEESPENRLSGEPEAFFLIDPLDGTRAFLAGAPDYCVLIALISAGEPIAGAVHAPATGHSWWAGHSAWASDDRAFAQVRPLTARPARANAPIAIISSLHAGESSRAMCGRLGITDIRCENSALKFARLAEGEADIYPRSGRTMQWDVAAGDALLRATGGGIFDLDGRRLRYGEDASGWANPDFIALRVLPEAKKPQ